MEGLLRFLGLYYVAASVKLINGIATISVILYLNI